MAKTFLDAGVVAAQARARRVVILLFLVPPVLYLGARVLTDEVSPRAKFDNELVADARKDVMWGVAGFGFLGILLGGGIWMAHRNRRTVRVVVDDAGLLYQSMFREVRVNWSEIVRIERVRGGRRGPLLRVVTRRGDFTVAPTMVDASKPLPAILAGTNGLLLRHADGGEEPATVDENPLLREIRAHLARAGEAGASFRGTHERENP